MARTISAFADTVSAILAAPDPQSCSRIYRKALATFDVNSFAVGEVDLTELERTVFYAIGWPDSFRKFYVEAGLVHRDPVVEGLRYRHAPFTWSELRRDRKLSILGYRGAANSLRERVDRGTCGADTAGKSSLRSHRPHLPA